MKEIDYQKFLENLLKSNHKKVKYGITDITTENEHIEIKKWSDYKSALGQIISYNTCDKKDKLSVYFFGEIDVNKKIEIIDLFKKNGICVNEFDIVVNKLYNKYDKECILFIDNYLEFDENYKKGITCSEIWNLYNKWCLDNDKKIITQKELYKEIQNIFNLPDKIRLQTNGRNSKGWRNLKFK